MEDVIFKVVKEYILEKVQFGHLMFQFISQGHDFYDLNVIPKVNPIQIGKNCWIGTNSTILPGIKLGDRTIVRANTVKTKSFPAGNVIIAGTPAKIVREI